MEVHAVNGHGTPESKNSVDEMVKTPHVVESGLPSSDERDAQALARLGKKPVLKGSIYFTGLAKYALPLDASRLAPS
ncbi:MAG: hypothetical protein Q9185_004550 [Variospora sp. 1 TL-2023]